MTATIIGGGIIGLSTAYYLQQDGWDVTVLDRGDGSDGCSFGNMGYLSPSHFVPLAQPGVISQGILWMFKQKSPFYVRPALSWDLMDWGLKFVRACNAGHVSRSARPMAELLRQLSSLLEKRGAKIIYKAQVFDIQKDKGRIKTVKFRKSTDSLHSGETISIPDLVVLAAGFWS